MIGLSHDVRRLSDLRARIATALAIMLVAATGAAARAAETVRLEADLKARTLPAIDDWIRKRNRD